MSEKKDVTLPIAEGADEKDNDNYDRRRHVRIPLRTPVTVIEGWTRITFYAVNISVGGLFVETYVIYRTGTHLNLSFQLPGNEAPIKVIGEVRHHYRFTFVDSKGRDRIIFGIGVRFVHFEDDGMERVESFIGSRRDEYIAERKNKSK